MGGNDNLRKDNTDHDDSNVPESPLDNALTEEGSGRSIGDVNKYIEPRIESTPEEDVPFNLSRDLRSHNENIAQSLPRDQAQETTSQNNGMFLELFSSAWAKDIVEQESPSLAHFEATCPPFEAICVAHPIKKRGRPRKDVKARINTQKEERADSSSNTPLTAGGTQPGRVDQGENEAIKTWEIGQAVGMMTNNNEEVHSLLR